MSYDRTVRIPDEHEAGLKALAEEDSLKPGPWMSKVIIDAIKARTKKTKRKKSKR